MSVPALGVSPATATAAYGRVASGASPEAVGGGFGDALSRAMNGLVSTGRAADEAALKAVRGEGNVTDVVTAVSRAELALQGALAVRDKVVQAYQDIMRMPI